MDYKQMQREMKEDYADYLEEAERIEHIEPAVIPIIFSFDFEYKRLVFHEGALLPYVLLANRSLS